MKQADIKEFAKIMMLLNETFVGNQNISKQLIEVYFRALNKYEIEDVKRLANNFVNTWDKKFLPLPANFIKELEGTKEDNALEVWQYVLKQISSKGIRNCKFDTATTNAINSVGGIEAIGLLDRDKLTFKQKDFCRAYEVTEKREELKEIGNKRFNALTDNLVKKIGV